MAECATLPCSSSTFHSGVAFEIINNSGGAITGRANNGVGVRGSSNSDYGVYGSSNSDYGVYGYSTSNYGVYGLSPRNYGVRGGGTVGLVGVSTLGTGSAGIGVWGSHRDSGWGVYGSVVSSSGYAGYFAGRVYVSGFLSKPGGGFRIDHPSDPDNKYLNHSFVESSEMKNLYDGVVTLDIYGEAVVELPEWFEALNQDFRYQLTCIGEYAPIYVAQEIERSRLRNSFKIAGGREGMKVSWQVTGVRRDPWAQANSMAVEEEKSYNQRGYYLHPEVYGQSEERSIEWADNPELMRQLKEERENPPSIDIPEALEEQ